MSFQAIRSHIESRVGAAFTALSPSVACVWDNVQETPPALPYARCIVSYVNTTEPLICQTESMTESLRGNLQISVYASRGQGMSMLELYGAEAMKVMNQMYDGSGSVRVKCGMVSGPTPVLATDAPYVVVTVSCPFQARVIDDGSGDDDDDGSGSDKIKSSDVLLTNPVP